MEIHFTKHAEEKFQVLKNHSFVVRKIDVMQTVQKPEALDFSKKPLIIAQRKIDTFHYLRVVYKIENNFIKVITFYPARINQYEKRTKKYKN